VESRSPTVETQVTHGKPNVAMMVIDNVDGDGDAHGWGDGCSATL